MNNLNKYLKKRRLELGFSQQDVSKFLGLKGLQFISNIERCTAPMPPKYFRKLGLLFKVKPNYLIGLAMKDHYQYLKKEAK